MESQQIEMDLFGGMQLANQVEMVNDEIVSSFSSEHDAIFYSINRATKTTGCTHEALANIAGMTKGQWSYLWSGFRGIPKSSFIGFIQATGTAALLVYYASHFELVVKPKLEWSQKVRENEQLKERVKRLEASRIELERRLMPYENVG